VLALVVVILYLIDNDAGSKNPLLVVRSTCAILPGPKDDPLLGRAATRKLVVFSGNIRSGSEKLT
jgi:hypothetical protein